MKTIQKCIALKNLKKNEKYKKEINATNLNYFKSSKMKKNPQNGKYTKLQKINNSKAV